MKQLKNFISWPLHEKLLLINSLYWVGCYFVIVYLFPKRMLKYFIGHPSQEIIDKPPNEIAEHTILSIKKSLARVIWLLNIKNKCLVYALTAKKLLLQKNIISFLYLGMKHDNGKILAHAWLISHKIDIVGCEQIHEYQVIGVFKS